MLENGSVEYIGGGHAVFFFFVASVEVYLGGTRLTREWKGVLG